MIELGSMTDKFSGAGQNVVRRAIDMSRSCNHNYLGLLHILAALSEIESVLFAEGMRAIDVDPHSVKSMVNQELSQSPVHVGRKMAIPEPTRDLFNRALRRARSQGRQQIESYDLFASLFTDQSGVPAEILRRLSVDPVDATETITQRVRTREEQTESLRKKYELPPYLKHFGVSLNKLARQDKLPPIIGREREIQQMIEVLCHRERANSPMLVGESGVGKTAVVEGL